MKKIFVFLALMTMTIAANAQSETPFKQGKFYANAGLSGFGLNYNADSKWNFGLNLRGGYLFKDNWIALGEFVWGMHQRGAGEFQLGAGARYCIEQNGLYLGAGARYKHQGSLNDFVPNVNVGYSFFLSRTITLEPELYFDISTKNFSKYTEFGLRVGVGVYLFEK